LRSAAAGALRGGVVCLAIAAPGCRDRDAPVGSSPSATAEEPVKTVDDEPVKTVDDEPVKTVDDEPDPSEGSEAVEHERACAPADPSLKPMQLLRLTLASGIEGRDPRDRLAAAKAGKRVYAHLRMRNRSGRDRCLRLRFSVGGELRTEVTLRVGHSWSWRTWAYATLRDDDSGSLRIEVIDDQDAPVAARTLGIVAR
jgi:hypothetical protein